MRFNTLMELKDEPNIFHDKNNIRANYNGWKELTNNKDDRKKKYKQIVSVYYLEYAFAPNINKAYLWIKCTYNSHNIDFWGLYDGSQTILQGSPDKITSYMNVSIDEVVSDLSSKSMWDMTSVRDTLGLLKREIIIDDDKNGALATPDNNGQKWSKNGAVNWDGKLTITMTYDEEHPEGKYIMSYLNIPSGEKELVDRRFKRPKTSVKTLIFDGTDYDKTGNYIVTGKKLNLDTLESFIGELGNSYTKKPSVKPDREKMGEWYTDSWRYNKKNKLP